MKVKFSLILILLLSGLSFFATHFSTSMASGPPEVAFEFWMDVNQTAFMTVTITCYESGYNITDWGTAVRNNSDFYAEFQWADVEGDIGIPMIYDLVHNYSLGQLDEGVYSFTLVASGYPWHSTVFEVGFPADINDDGKVDIKDIAIVAKAFGTHNPNPDYNPAADIHYDGKIDIKDIAFTAKHYGE